ncbi:MAG: phosphatidylglycerophosphatase A [Acidobacteria bacterium]|nr:phosphatidylglycerophosphatase A [Acidobacteriota bacterium]MCA1609366.1 phosphatidylglycerophosphatase A [Acidobacteriota bacterium]
MAESTLSLSRAFRERPIAILLSTGLGVGFVPVAPGTAGSLLALVVAAGALALFHRLHEPSMAAAVGLLASGLLVGAIGVPVTTRASRAMGGKDPAAIVLDEVSGQWIACAPIPLFAYASAGRAALVWLVAFLVFRLFDVWKPGAIHRLQDLPEGLGIMVDDVLAGALAAGVTLLVGKALSA